VQSGCARSCSDIFDGILDWLLLLGPPGNRVRVEDTDVAAGVSGAVDRVLCIHAQPEYLVHLDDCKFTVVVTHGWLCEPKCGCCWTMAFSIDTSKPSFMPAMI
jgi:hypothetical protein